MNTRVNDFTFYWTAAHELLAGHNPYAPTPHGFVMLAPPWIFPVTLSFGALPLDVAQFLWLAVSTFALTIAGIWLRELYGEGQSPFVTGLLVATFGAVLVMFLLGQTVPLVLFGLAGFLRYESRRSYLAGAFLFLAALKPQIVFLLWPVLLLCGLFQQRWKTLMGFAATFSLASIFALAMRPSVFREYWTILRAKEVHSYGSSAIGALLSRASGSAWMQYLPMALAFVWLFWCWQTVKPNWDWKTQLPGILAVSLAGAPYAWFSDQAVLLPAVLYAGGRLRRAGVPIAPPAVAYLLLNLSGLGLLLDRKVGGYSWMPLAWLVFYSLIRLRTGADGVAGDRADGADDWRDRNLPSSGTVQTRL
jgi:hypothetical protein